MLELSSSAARQYIDAVSVFEALEEALREAGQVRGGMYWHGSNSGMDYLVRTSSTGAEKGLGPRSAETEAVYAKFMERKSASEERVAGLKAALAEHQRMNKALRVGRVDPLVIKLLNRLELTGLSEHFRVVGTHALYAYEAAAGIRFSDGALATRDIDLLWDVRRRVLFATQLAKVDGSMLGVLKKVDPTFRVRDAQKYTAVNKHGFEVDIIRREQSVGDPHPIRLSADEDDFWVAQAKNSHLLLDSPGFSAVIVASNGTMARMDTVHPLVFSQFKRWMSALPDRLAIKRRRDALQAEVVDQVVKTYLPNLAATPAAAVEFAAAAAAESATESAPGSASDSAPAEPPAAPAPSKSPARRSRS